MRYKSKPVEIEAVQFTGDNVKELQNFTKGQYDRFYMLDEHDHTDDPEIVAEIYDELHSTWVGVKVGNYIIRGMKGEFYPCDEAVFNEKYEPVDG